jgi:hypothetical protein
MHKVRGSFLNPRLDRVPESNLTVIDPAVVYAPAFYNNWRDNG